MAYIGKEPTVGNFQVCDAISVVNGQAAYTMQVSSVNVLPESENHMLVSLNGILQRPGSSFTVSGSTITFASNLVTGDVINFIHILGSVLDLGVPSDSTVSLAKLTATGTKDATTFLRGDNTFAAAGGGKVLQVLTYTDSTARSTSSSGWQIASNTMGGDITPSATSSKILAIVSTNVSVTANDGSLTLFRDSTNLGHATYGLDYIHVAGNYRSSCTVLLDSPSSTSALTYQVKIAKHNVAYGGSVTINSETALGRLILLEIGA